MQKDIDLGTLKKQAAYRAVEYVESGMIVGLGTGSTAVWAVRRMAELLEQGKLKNILGIPSSSMIEEEARRLNFPLTNLDEHPEVDLTIDGADEVDPAVNLIKGGGGALLREKILAQASRREIIVVDETKLSERLGQRFYVPVEVYPYGWKSQRIFLQSLGSDPRLRLGATGAPYRTDQNNFILDAHFGPIENPAQLASKLENRAGIAGHGLFIGIASEVIVAGVDGMRFYQPKKK